MYAYITPFHDVLSSHPGRPGPSDIHYFLATGSFYGQHANLHRFRVIRHGNLFIRCK